jgi:hypothetical protein
MTVKNSNGNLLEDSYIEINTEYIVLVFIEILILMFSKILGFKIIKNKKIKKLL